MFFFTFENKVGMIDLKVKLAISLNCVHYLINGVHYPIMKTFYLSLFNSCHWNAIVQIGTTWGKVWDGNRPWIWNWHLMAEESNTLIWPQNAIFFFAQHKCSTVPWLDFGSNKISHPPGCTGQSWKFLELGRAGAAIFPGARAGRGGECIPETGSIIWKGLNPT